MEIPSLSSIAQAFRMLIELIDTRGKKNQAYLHKEIEPIFRNMESIHLEYMCTFQQLRDLAERRAAPPAMICAFLKHHRLESLHIRDLTRELAASLRWSRTARSADRELASAMRRFSRSVGSYFGSVTVAAHASWYSRFVDSLTRLSDLEENPWDAAEGGIAGNPIRSMIRVLDHLLQRVLPSKWRSVCNAYAKLRALLV